MKKEKDLTEKYRVLLYVTAWFLCLALLLITDGTFDRR